MATQTTNSRQRRTPQTATTSSTRTNRARVTTSYDAAKQFEGQRYTGMRVGRSHRWNYEQGAWRERRVRPDDPTFIYAATKRRAGRAPEGSGAPIGTEYHWFVLADQLVKKLDANSYSTSRNGQQVVLAPKRAGAAAWSASAPARRRHQIKVLQQMSVHLHGDDLVESAAAPRARRRSNATP